MTPAMKIQLDELKEKILEDNPNPPPFKFLRSRNKVVALKKVFVKNEHILSATTGFKGIKKKN